MGIVPSNTTLTVVYHKNSQSTVSAPIDTINPVKTSMTFQNENELNGAETFNTRQSLECTNEGSSLVIRFNQTQKR